MGYSTESRVYLVQAVDVLKKAHDSDDCGSCRGMVAEEITHLEGLITLTDGVREYVDMQVGTTKVLTEGVQRVNTALGGTTPESEPPKPSRPPGGLMSMVRDRPRLLDMINLGR